MSKSDRQAPALEALAEAKVLLVILAGEDPACGRRGLLESPYDWWSLGTAARGLFHLCRGQRSPFCRAVDYLRAQWVTFVQTGFLARAEGVAVKEESLLFDVKHWGFGQRGSSAAVQEAGCKILALLSQGGQSYCTEASRIRRTIVRLGGCAALRVAMTEHMHVEQIQEYSCNALANLASDGSLDFSSEGEQSMRAVMCAAQAHPNAEAMQYQVCRALNGICCALSSSFVRCSGVGLVLTAMRRHLHSARLQREASELLTQVCGDAAPDRDFTVAEIAFGGGVELVIRAMCAHQAEASLQASYCHILESCFASPVATETVRAEGAVEALVAAMEAHKGDDGVQESARAALRTLSDSHDARCGSLALRLAHVIL